MGLTQLSTLSMQNQTAKSSPLWLIFWLFHTHPIRVVEFSLGHSNRVRVRGALAEDLI